MLACIGANLESSQLTELLQARLGLCPIVWRPVLRQHSHRKRSCLCGLYWKRSNMCRHHGNSLDLVRSSASALAAKSPDLICSTSTATLSSSSTTLLAIRPTFVYVRAYPALIMIRKANTSCTAARSNSATSTTTANELTCVASGGTEFQQATKTCGGAKGTASLNPIIGLPLPPPYVYFDRVTASLNCGLLPALLGGCQMVFYTASDCLGMFVRRPWLRDCPDHLPPTVMGTGTLARCSGFIP